jgi:hypothetical protein
VRRRNGPASVLDAVFSAEPLVGIELIKHVRVRVERDAGAWSACGYP